SRLPCARNSAISIFSRHGKARNTCCRAMKKRNSDAAGRQSAVGNRMADENSIHSYRDLRVWNEAMELAVACYRMTGSFPREEMFGMTSQIRRASASVPANIAEGYGRESAGSYVQFLR